MPTTEFAECFAYLSTWTDDWVEIPIAEALFEKYLKERCEEEDGLKKFPPTLNP